MDEQQIAEVGESTTSPTSSSRSADWQAEAHERWMRAGFPSRHLERIVECVARGEDRPEYGVAAAAKLAKALNALEDDGLVGLIGKRGTGKTLAACHMARYWSWARQGRDSIRYIHVAEMLSSIRYASTDGGRPEHQVVDDWAQIGLLIVDEVQDRRESDWEQQTLSWLIDKRYGTGRPTLLISNLLPAEFAKSLGPSIVDRMRETGVIVECNWESFRKPRVTKCEGAR